MPRLTQSVPKYSRHKASGERLRSWEQAHCSSERAAHNQPERASVRLGNNRNDHHVTRTTTAAQWTTMRDIPPGG